MITPYHALNIFHGVRMMRVKVKRQSEYFVAPRPPKPAKSAAERMLAATVNGSGMVNDIQYAVGLLDASGNELVGGGYNRVPVEITIEQEGGTIYLHAEEEIVFPIVTDAWAAPFYYSIFADGQVVVTEKLPRVVEPIEVGSTYTLRMHRITNETPLDAAHARW